MQIIWGLYGVFFAISIGLPFVNQYLNVVFGFNPSFVYILSVFFSILVFFLQSKVFINKSYFIIFTGLIVAFLMNLDSSLTNGFYSILIGFVLSLPFLQKNIPDAFLKIFSVSLLLFSSIFFLLIVTDSRISDVIFLQTRMALGNSPISIAILGGLSFLICVNYIKTSDEPVSIKKLFFIFMGLFFVSAIIFSGSRGPLLAIFIIFFIQMIRRGKIIWLVLISIASMFAGLFIIKARGNAGASNSSRLELYSEAFQIVSKSPMGGFNIGKYQMLTGKPFPHNFFLEVWVDLNIFFLLVFILLTLYVVFQRYFFLYENIGPKKSLLIDMYVLIFICCQFSLPSLEMLRVLIPLLFVSLCCIHSSKYYNHKMR